MTDIDKKYIVWLDYGCEGWQPRGFNSLEEMEKFIIEGRDTYGEQRIYTRKIEVKVKVDVTAEKGGN